MTHQNPIVRSVLPTVTLVALGLLLSSAQATAAISLNYGLNVSPVPPADAQGIGNNGMGDLTAAGAQALYDGGVRKVRIVADWADVQPNGSNDANWAKIDKNVANAVAAGLKFVIVIDSHRPVWADPDPALQNYSVSQHQYPISATGRANFAQFVNRLTDRYGAGTPSGAGLDGIEIWNEVTVSRNSYYYNQPGPNGANYQRLVAAAKPSIRDQAPGAKILVGAVHKTNSNALVFIDKFFAQSGVRNDFDIFTVHPYSTNDPNPATTATAKSVNDTLVARIHNNDAGRRIWVTEFGVASGTYTDGPYVATEQDQASFIDAMVRYFRGNPSSYNEDVVFLFTLEDSDKPSWVSHAGLFRWPSGDPKPAWYTYSGLASGG